VAVVCGPGGTGASTVAIALAQGLADATGPSGVLLADFALRGELAMLHDARDVVPSVQELVEAHRSGRPTGEDVRAMTFGISERGYHLLLGLRRSRSWSSLRPRALEAAVKSLRQTFRVVVCDIDPLFEGEAETGSLDVEERHAMSRVATAAAGAVVVVGACGMKGLHSLVSVVADILDFGVPAGRIVPVFNRAPRSPRARSELAQGFAALLPDAAATALPAPIFLPERAVEEALRDGVRLPVALTDPLTGAYRAVIQRSGTSSLVVTGAEPQLVRPGSLGGWAGPDDERSEVGDTPPDAAAVG